MPSVLHGAASVLPFLTICVVAPHAGAQRSSQIPWTEQAIASNKLGEERKIYVVTPSEYDSTRGVAVLVLLDANDRPQFEAAIANVRFLESRRAIPPLLIVGIPNGKDRPHDLTPPALGPDAMRFPTAGGADRFADFITQEVLPAVRARYRTLPQCRYNRRQYYERNGEHHDNGVLPLFAPPAGGRATAPKHRAPNKIACECHKAHQPHGNSRHQYGAVADMAKLVRYHTLKLGVVHHCKQARGHGLADLTGAQDSNRGHGATVPQRPDGPPAAGSGCRMLSRGQPRRGEGRRRRCRVARRAVG